MECVECVKCVESEVAWCPGRARWGAGLAKAHGQQRAGVCVEAPREGWHELMRVVRRLSHQSQGGAKEHTHVARDRHTATTDTVVDDVNLFVIVSSCCCVVL